MSQVVLVTGGAGYIGSHACKALAKAGFTPVTFDNLSRGSRDAVRWGPFEHGDVLDRVRLDQVLETYKPVAAMHFAAFAYVGESVREPGRYYRNNVVGTLTLLQALLGNGVNRFVFSSSCAIYGSPESIPISEATDPHPVNPYGRTKWFSEQIIRDFGNAHDLRWMALRYFNAAGSDPDCEIGENLGLEPRIIPRAIAAALGQVAPLKIFGDDYDTPDGTCIRDYIHVCDIAAAHVRSLEFLMEDRQSQALNLGTGRGYSIRKVIETIEKISGKPVPVEFAPRRQGDPAILVADPKNANQVLGWKPRFADLADSIRTALAWREKLN